MTILRYQLVIIFLSVCVFIGVSSAQIDRPAAAPTPNDSLDRRSTGVHITNIPSVQPLPQQQQFEDRIEESAQEQLQRESAKVPESIPLPPEPDIEFQDFVSSSLGYHLNIFGQSLFRNVPSTFAPVDRIPVTPDYLIGPGDELVLRAWGQIDVNYRAVVDRTGAIYLPKVGPISVAGVRYDQLNTYLKSAISRVFKNFELDVTLGRLRAVQVFVVGQVRRPGSYTVSSLSTLVNALFASGGPSKRGSMRRILLRREGKEVTSFDLYDLIAFGDKTKDVQLLSGDVILVPPVGRLVAIAGSVNMPGIYELKEHETLGEVLGYAGGFTTTASGQKTFIDRIDDRQVRHTAAVDLSSAGLKTELRDGDIVRVLHISPKFDNAITLRGNVAVPGRYPWREGMRVKDLIPSRDALVTQEFWKRQNKLAVDLESLTFKSRDDIEQGLQRQLESQDKNAPANEPASQNMAPDLYQSPSPSTPNGQNRNTQPDQRMQQPRNQDLAARVGRTEAQRIMEEQLKNEVKRSAAEINWEYAVIQRMDPQDLSTHLVPFNLGKAIAGDEGQNVILQPGDVITIFSQNDMQVPAGQQTKFVRLEGEFLTAGVYQAQSGETLRHLISRVGGLTPEAYLYGAEFTRESTREDQQKRLDEYINELEKSIERNASGQRSLTGDEAVAERQAVDSQRRLLDKLRQMRATGRIVLELKPTADNLKELPDLTLEDGDRLLVPFKPATVNVIGSVYNSNSFIFKPGKTVSDYMRLSGGPTKNGDKGRSFIIRADGTTLSGNGHNALFLNSFEEARLMPGDTIVVPEKLDKGAVLRGFKDWTQIISTFVIGAAAAKVLFP
ncbi:MAG TPA: SLBB domain-containing protein [Candidatus Angelobacter sp.]|jgi:protein involved in polysaccharide export with SLBB domain